MAKERKLKRPPKKVAVIDADNCAGCEACIEVCPVGCILLITQKEGVKGADSWWEVELERCIGCELCVRIPGKRSDVYEQLVKAKFAGLNRKLAHHDVVLIGLPDAFQPTPAANGDQFPRIGCISYGAFSRARVLWPKFKRFIQVISAAANQHGDGGFLAQLT